MNLYYVTPTGCAKIADYNNCVLSDGTTDQCIVCKRYYSLVGSTCVNNISIEAECKSIPSFYWYTNACAVSSITGFDYCLSFDSTSGKCTKCLPAYYVDINGNCIALESPVTAGCVGDGINKYCLYCTVDTYYVDILGKCVTPTVPCTNNHLTADCTYCVLGGLAGYYDSASTCKTNLLAIRNCVRFDSITWPTCLTCDNLYWLSSNSCQLINIRGC